MLATATRREIPSSPLTPSASLSNHLNVMQGVSRELQAKLALTKTRLEHFPCLSVAAKTNVSLNYLEHELSILDMALQVVESCASLSLACKH